MKSIMAVFGTRPEAVKMCPVVLELKKKAGVAVKVCVTGQHKEMLQQVLDLFEVIPDYNLNIMKESQTLFDITVLVLEKLGKILESESPDIVLVHGDTSTAFAAALACFYMKIPVGHVEAGLRTKDIYSPYPEEFNRQAISIISKYNFAPTEEAKKNLINEGKQQNTIYVTGNTVIDALKVTVNHNYMHPLIDWAKGSRLILLTVHRRENMGEKFFQMLEAIKETLEQFKDIKVIYPVHMNPAIHKAAYEVFGNYERVKLVEPLNVLDFHNIMARAYLILTDSGGVQEEASAFGKPVLVMRNTTERPEGVKAGILRLVGTEKLGIKKELATLLTDEKEYLSMSKAVNPYGDGYASKRIVDILCRDL